MDGGRPKHQLCAFGGARTRENTCRKHDYKSSSLYAQSTHRALRRMAGLVFLLVFWVLAGACQMARCGRVLWRFFVPLGGASHVASPPSGARSRRRPQESATHHHSSKKVTAPRARRNAHRAIAASFTRSFPHASRRAAGRRSQGPFTPHRSPVTKRCYRSDDQVALAKAASPNRRLRRCAVLRDNACDDALRAHRPAHARPPRLPACQPRLKTRARRARRGSQALPSRSTRAR